ncbi:MAG: DUF721 domain-containing protein [Acidimicrobiia bacterium]|nr:DUF721 domain-containing protein [Acidimicrobiia bacterium]NNF68133.1 DUF721 domain-containing protein [Acidimicrobiia bacterium]NNK92561.1 DUF721 domain-containing protein [Acidimicrobiia bacterium]
MYEPQRLDEVMDLVLSRIGVAAARHLDRLTTDWDALAAVPWSGRTRPLSLQEGHLVVGVDSGATASLVKYDIHGLIERLEAAIGPGIVSTVSLKVVGSGRQRR